MRGFQAIHGRRSRIRGTHMKHFLRNVIFILITILIVCLFKPAIEIYQRSIELENRHALVGTVALLEQIKLAVPQYKMIFGRFPWTLTEKKNSEFELVSTREVYSLLTEPTSKDATIFVDVTPRSSSRGTYVDGWGHEIQIGIHTATGEVVLWSLGKNGKDETLPLEVAGRPASTTEGAHGDDIVVRILKRDYQPK